MFIARRPGRLQDVEAGPGRRLPMSPGRRPAGQPKVAIRQLKAREAGWPPKEAGGSP